MSARQTARLRRFRRRRAAIDALIRALEQYQRAPADAAGGQDRAPRDAEPEDTRGRGVLRKSFRVGRLVILWPHC